MDEAGTQRAGWWATLGWAAYLACSWTWCIGMFLPVLLVRDFGVWGFVVFAVPNVVGAGAMVWVLARPEQSARLVERHQLACKAFSVVTVAFQLYFVVVLMRHGLLPAGILWAVLAILWIGAGSFVRQRVLAWFVLAASVIAVVLWFRIGSPGIPAQPPELSRSELLWLAPVSAFGFLLCPYLDLTFHRARQNTPGTAGPAAFGIGFGVYFSLMILFSLSYSDWMLEHLQAEGAVRSIAATVVGCHITLQLAFTVLVHSAEATQRRRDSLLLLVVAVVVIVFCAVFGADAITSGRWARYLTAEEVAYRFFMAFYGLVFPAYVWLAMIPTRDGHSGLGGVSGRRKLLVWCFAVGVAAPMFWMGFIERETWWLGPGLGVVLLARVALPRGRGRSPDGSESGPRRPLMR